MDFAKKQLEKYGWSEGKGLGKEETGISTPIKPRLKSDNAGLGYNMGEEYRNNWWETLYNNTTNNLIVNNTAEVKMRLKSTDPNEITSKKYRDPLNAEYGSCFIKGSQLTGNSTKWDIQPRVSNYIVFKDEQIFAACSGRTAHKGARHGCKQSGKLSRIEKQEKMLLKKMKKVSLTDNEEDKNNIQKKVTKFKKQKYCIKEKYTAIEEGFANTPLKKKKKKIKSVSFNETVTKILTVDLDVSSFESESGSTKDENSNEPILENVGSGSDEGIEQDIENNNNDPLDNHRSFEIAQFKISDLSKAERKKLKKKRKHEAKRLTSTEIFLQKLNDNCVEDECMVDFDEKDRNLKKRKFLDDSDYGDYKRGHSVTESPEKNRCKRNKKKRKKQRQIEEKQLNFIVKSFDNVCHISENE